MTPPTSLVAPFVCPHCGQRLPKTMGERIRAARRNLGISRAELERRAKLSPGTATRYEQGQRTPSLSSLWRVAEVLGVSAASLVESMILLGD